MNNTKRIILFITILLGQTTISFCENIENQWGLKAIDVATAWKITKGDSDIKVALIDYGVETTHPGLRENICGNYNCFPGFQNPFKQETHGTNCVGVICATNNDTMVGVAPLCKLSTIRILYYRMIYNQTDSTPDNNIDVNWYKKINSENLLKDIRIINCSWGGENNVPEEENFLDSLYKNNHIIIVASGNYGSAIGETSKNVRFPANLSSTLSVGAIGEKGYRMGSNIYSVCDISSCYGEELDVVAPGMNILTTTLNGGYAHCTGTSLACPHVAGIAALMLSVNPDLTSEEVYSIIKSTCTKLPNYEFKKDATHIYGTWDKEVGYGLVNAYYAVAAAKAHKATIKGNSHLCGVETYTVNIPDSAVVQWNVSTTLVSLVKGQGTTSATFEYIESDDAPYTATITAKITYREHSFTLSKTIQVGTERPFIQMSNTQGGIYVNSGNVGNRYYIYASANNVELSTNSKDYKWSVTPSSNESNKLQIQGNPYVFTPSEEGIYTFNLVYNGDCGEVSISKSYHFYQKDNSGGGTVIVSPNPSTDGYATVKIKKLLRKEMDSDAPLILDNNENDIEAIKYSVKSLVLPTFDDEETVEETFFLQVWSNGQLIKSLKSENSNQLNISTADLAAGIYQLVVILENGEFYGSTQLIVY